MYLIRLLKNNSLLNIFRQRGDSISYNFSNNEQMLTEEEVAKITNPLKAIKAKCYDCCAYQLNEVKLCPATRCPLWHFRFGNSPYLKKELSEEKRKAIGQRLKEAREKKKMRD